MTFLSDTRALSRGTRILILLVGLGMMGMSAATPSAAQPEELPLGSRLPATDASLTRVDGTTTSVTDVLGPDATVFIFWSNQCPWVDKYEARVQAMVEEYSDQGVRFVLVNANDASAFPRESLEASLERAESSGYDATYVRDDGAQLASALGASRTPHVFVFDDQRTLVYAGSIDNSPADADGVTKPYLRDALTAVLADDAVPVSDTKAFGCMLKDPS